MTSTTHPDEAQLFAYVEGDPTAPDVPEHVRACPVCAERVAELEAGRDALRTAPLLQLPERRARGIMEQLDRMADERRERVRRLRDGWSFTSPKRLVAVLTPIAAVVAVVAVLASTSGTGDDVQREAGGAPAAEDAGGGQESAAALAAAPVRSVEGSAGQVARFLRQQGLDAEAVGDRVEVRDASPQRVRDALAGIEDGPVPVVIAP